MPTITPFLWFENQAEQAMAHYLSIFKNGRTIEVSRLGEGILTVTFELEGQRFIGLNAGPHHKFNEAVSLFVSCETQQEVDYYWEKLLAGGSESGPGWLKDKFGVSWQVIPTALGRLMSDPNPAKARATAAAMMTMRKLVISDLQKAHDEA